MAVTEQTSAYIWFLVSCDDNSTLVVTCANQKNCIKRKWLEFDLLYGG